MARATAPGLLVVDERGLEENRDSPSGSLPGLRGKGVRSMDATGDSLPSDDYL